MSPFILIPLAEAAASIQRSAMDWRVVYTERPGSMNYIPSRRQAECKGCGAPLEAHVCSYCRRPA
jgi:hypothetical protein